MTLATSSRKVIDGRVQIVLGLMEADLRNRWRVEELARAVNLSYSGLRHLIAKETGYSPLQHLQKMRMNRAKELLTSTQLTIDQISLDLGWQDRSHFERAFKRDFQITPAKFRSRYNMEPQNVKTAIKQPFWP